MHIISGIYKGRKIVVDKESGIRPTTSRVREAVFNILLHSSFFNKDFSDMHFLDLFCGTGAIGIEAISRGVNHVTMVDINTDCCSSNVENFNIDDKITILNSDACNLDSVRRKCDIVFADPPYNFHLDVNSLLYHLHKNEILMDRCLIIIEGSPPGFIGSYSESFNLLLNRKYGTSMLTVLSFSGVADGNFP